MGRFRLLRHFEEIPRSAGIRSINPLSFEPERKRNQRFYAKSPSRILLHGQAGFSSKHPGATLQNTEEVDCAVFTGHRFQRSNLPDFALRTI